MQTPLSRVFLGDEADWMVRVRVILEFGETRPFEAFDRYADRKDIDEIIDDHLVQGRIVERLRLPEDAA